MKISELKERIINEIPIYDVIAMRLTPIGHEFKCPFHNADTVGSFRVDRKSNRYKCFTCDKYGDAINFIMDYDHVTFNQAVVIIASAFGLITKEEADRMGNYFKVDATVEEIHDYVSVNVDQREMVAAASSVLDAVYNVVISNSPLTIEHRNHLHERGFDDETIELYRFFSMTGNDLSNEVSRAALIWNVGVDELSRVPGFYNENGELRMLSLKGIGIPLFNNKGSICGIQVRKDEEDTQRGRYVLFSAHSKGGVSCGTLFDTVYPESFLKFKNANRWLSMNDASTVEKYREKIKDPQALKTLVITEGHFKAVSLTAKCNNKVITLSVQGVNNIKGIELVIKELSEIFGINKIIIAFDADFIINSNVAKAIYKLDLQLRKNFKQEILCLIWNINDGKGIDDYLSNQNKKSKFIFCKTQSFIKFLIKYHHKFPIQDKKDERLVNTWCDNFFDMVLKVGKVK